MRQHSSPAAPLVSAQMFTDLLKEDWMPHSGKHDPVSHVLVSDCIYTGLEATYAASQGLLVSVRNYSLHMKTFNST